MTDPMNDLRQASADVSGVEVLSPAAKAVLDALPSAPHLQMVNRAYAAAVLRAAADQVAPKFWYEEGYDIYAETLQDVSQNLLAIATELENTQ